MANDALKKTSLWTRTLAPKPKDQDSEAREKLRSALLQMRDNVIPLVRRIHHDVLGITVHDESHLDALWEVADEICGPDFELTPIEAFVFGASVLLHDTAMSLPAYPGGKKELRNLEIWRDFEVAARSHFDNEADIEQSILFAVLRSLHAAQAEKLASITFSRPNSSEAIPLLESTPLRDALASTIGKIAHSHHWDASTLQKRFNVATGAPPDFPSSWTLNEVKVACMLRCADAAHLDSRRAPTMLFAISEINAGSLPHWEFQNRLNKVTRQGDKLIFNSGKPFGVAEASSWWLCFETLRMVDREVKSSNAILDEIGSISFAARSVAGIESPQLLSRYARVEGWKPVSAEVIVSDPIELAKTLGGRDLYGANHFAPARELLQNAADAIRARRTLECRPEGWGEIRIVVEADGGESEGWWLHIDDNGVGMSERILTGPLIDFGKSLWSSSLLQDELPGLSSRGLKNIGKFGIGFFSVFLFGDNVRVISRKYTEGASDARVMEFSGLVRRPLVRKATTGELPVDFSTRISVHIPKKLPDLPESQTFSSVNAIGLSRYCQQLVAALDINVTFDDNHSKSGWIHSWDWTSVDASTLISELYGEKTRDIHDVDIDRLDLLSSDDGQIFGRMAYQLLKNTRERKSAFVSVGGFVTQSARFSSSTLDLSNVIGVVSGESLDASRNYAEQMVPDSVASSWATRQIEKIDPTTVRDFDLLKVTQDLFNRGADTKDFPYCYLSGKLVSYGELITAIRSHDSLILPASHSSYEDTFSLRGIFDLHPTFFSRSIKDNVACLTIKDLRGDLLSNERRRDIVKVGNYVFLEDDILEYFDDPVHIQFLRDCATIWGCEVKVELKEARIDRTSLFTNRSNSWVFEFSKGEILNTGGRS